MFPRTVELAFRRFQTHRDPRSLAIVFDRTAPELLALGRHIGSPGTDAEDLVQATFVTAIEDAASHRPGERVLPWLVGILVNHARAARRRSRRAIDAARLPQPVGDAAADVAANEVTAELKAAIDRLPEVYRPVLRLLCEHGLAANEIARTLERPAGTVRAQVARGLDLLRRALPASLAGGAAVTVAAGRGLAAVRSEVLAHCGGTATGFVSAVTLGGLLVLQQKVLAAFAALVLLAVGVLFWQADPPITAAPRASVEPPAAAVSATGRSAAPADAPKPAREADSPPSEPTVVDPAKENEPLPAATGGLRVHVFDADGRPCAGIGVGVQPVSALQDLGQQFRHVPTAEGGRVAWAGLAPGEWAIDVDRMGTVRTATVKIGRTIEQRIDLQKGVRVRGTVRERGGNPVPGAQVVVHGNRAGTVVVTTTDMNGAFVLEHVAAGVELQAKMPWRAPSLAHAVRGAPGSETTLDLVIGEAARTVTGRVLDPDAQPIAGISIALMPASASTFDPRRIAEPQVRATWLRTGDDGTFRCDEASAAPQLVFATAASRGLSPAWTEVDATRGEVFVELRLARGATLAGRVSKDGQPATGLQVIAWQGEGMRIGYLANLFGMRYAQVGGDGAFSIAGLAPGRASVRLLQGASVLRDATLVLRDGETSSWSTDLGAAAGLTIAVGGAPRGDTPLVAIVTKSQLVDGEMPSIVPIQGDGKGEHAPLRTEAVDVVLACLPGGPSILQIAAVRNVPPSQRTVQFDLSPAQVPSRSIRGRLVDAARAPVAAATVVAMKASADGLVVRVETTTASDGSFALGPLPAGEYTLLTGSLRDARPIGSAVLTPDRDEPVGDLALPR